MKARKDILGIEGQIDQLMNMTSKLKKARKKMKTRKFRTILEDSIQTIKCDGEDHVSIDKSNTALHTPAGACKCKPKEA